MASVLEKDVEEQARELARFDNLLKDAHDKPWWREFITTVRWRRDTMLMSLADGLGDQRSEDKLRGRISELNWFIVLDDRASGLNKPLEGDNG